MDGVTIIRQYQTQEIGAQNKLAQVVVIDFNVGTDGPFSLRIPLTDYTADNARALLQKLVFEIQGVQNI